MILVAKSIGYGALVAAAMEFDAAKLMFPVGTVLTLIGGVWWLGRKLQSFEDRMDAAEKWRADTKEMIEGLPCRLHCGIEVKFGKRKSGEAD